jgi:hypothetical protein
MQWQHKLSIGLLTLLCSCQNPDRSSVLAPSVAVPLRRSYNISAGTVGIVAIQKETPKNYELKVIFPDLFVPNSGKQAADRIRLKKGDLVSLQHSLQLFNANGTSIDITKILSIEIEQWCENDGGPHYRSIAKLRIPKNQLSQSIDRVSQVENFALFAVVGNLNDLQPLTTPFFRTTGTGAQKITQKLILEGKQSQPNRLLLRVIEQDSPMSYGCGDRSIDLPSLTLETATGTSDLRCCGP